MQVFNLHRNELMEIINIKTKKIDKICNKLSNQIYQYSDDRLQMLLKQKDKMLQQLNQLNKEKQQNKKIANDLKEQLQFLKQQESLIVKKISQKQSINEMLEKQLIYADQKNNQEQPYISSFITQMSKAQNKNKKIKYAKDKLNLLENTYRKECKEVQQKYRLVKMMREKLDKMNRQSHNFDSIKQTNQTTFSDAKQSIMINQSQNILVIRDKKQFFPVQDSSMSTYRDYFN